MEMMAAEEDVDIGVDLFQPLSPLAFSLYDSFLTSHCSCCFALLSPPHCSAAAVLPPDVDISPLLPSDIRVALHLLDSVSLSTASLPHRLGGLLTNHHLLMADSSISGAIKHAASLVDRQDTELVEAAICTVLTNAVEVQDTTGLALGIAVYDPPFSWINHSCFPNACYRFLISKEHVAVAYGPKVIVRSIKRINRGEEITVSYIDLLQPTGLRHSDLWSRYRFMCDCARCNASPPAYIDSVLEGVIALEPKKATVAHHDGTTSKDEAVGKMTDHIKEAIDDFLSDNISPKTCCEEIESVLHHGIQNNASSQPHQLLLHPSHHVALHAYITLATAYRIRSSLSETNRALNGKAFDMSRISAAYSFFLAGVSHQLFTREPSLVISAANFWTRAGELLDLAQNFLKESSGEIDVKCTKCYMLESPYSHRDIKENSRQLLRCVTDISQVTWSFLSRGCPYLQKFKSPLDFSVTVTNGDREGDGEESSEDQRVSILLLSSHCLLYADLLTDLCYGRKLHLLS